VKQGGGLLIVMTSTLFFTTSFNYTILLSVIFIDLLFFILYFLYKNKNYFLIGDGRLIYREGLVSSTQKCDINDIIRIESCYGYAGLKFVQIVFSKNKKEDKIIPNVFFSPDILNALFCELRELNPNIKIDKEVQKILNTKNKK
jgi:hypothetical protein